MSLEDQIPTIGMVLYWFLSWSRFSWYFVISMIYDTKYPWLIGENGVIDGLCNRSLGYECFYRNTTMNESLSSFFFFWVRGGV